MPFASFPSSSLGTPLLEALLRQTDWLGRSPLAERALTEGKPSDRTQYVQTSGLQQGLPRSPTESAHAEWHVPKPQRWTWRIVFPLSSSFPSSSLGTPLLEALLRQNRPVAVATQQKPWRQASCHGPLVPIRRSCHQNPVCCPIPSSVGLNQTVAAQLNVHDNARVSGDN